MCPVYGLRKDVFPEGEARKKFYNVFSKHQPVDLLVSLFYIPLLSIRKSNFFFLSFWNIEVFRWYFRKYLVASVRHSFLYVNSFPVRMPISRSKKISLRGSLMADNERKCFILPKNWGQIFQNWNSGHL